ncbi:phosphoglucomutase/phosphomannomutase family protein, partial [Candidatus Dependentiae bacterium]|nr:phosphoglucomutase/phosphomannomutase family protein [Candidatus Dependentiae bacterium]
MKTDIKFGTDGWRGVIAKDFTFEKVELVAHAYAAYVLKKNKNKIIVIGYDGRFISNNFARRMGEVLTAYGIKVFLSNKIIPTPFLSFAAVVKRAYGGIMITASHNPAEYNGIKFKTGTGGSVSKKVTAEVESNINKILNKKIKIKTKTNDKLLLNFDVTNDYINQLYKNIDIDLINKKKFKVLYESMGGAGLGILEKILKKVKIINQTDKFDPLFAGRYPEPLEENVKPAIKHLREIKADLGIVTDGDADRIAFIDEKGNFINSQKILGFLLLHLIKNKNYKAGVGITFAVSSIMENICTKKSIKLFTKPIGFKYIAELMEQGKVGYGGEESGGIGYYKQSLERDGIFISLLTLEMMAMEKKKLSEIIMEMQKEFGKYYYDRIDLRITKNQIDNFKKKLPSLSPKTMAGLKVLRVEKIDGKKFILTQDSWLLMRPSGT